MSVTLEHGRQEAAIAEEAVELVEPEAVAEVEEVVQEVVAETVEEVVPEPEAVQEPEKRGRPKAAPTQKVAKAKAVTKPIAPTKAVRMKPPSESSDDDDKLTHDDMETLLLDYHAKCKQVNKCPSPNVVSALRTLLKCKAGIPTLLLQIPDLNPEQPAAINVIDGNNGLQENLQELQELQELQLWILRVAGEGAGLAAFDV